MENSTPNELGKVASTNVRNLVSVMTIKHNDPVIEFVENETFDLAGKPDEPRRTKETKYRFFTDGRGEMNVLGIEYVSKTRWVGARLVVTNYSWGPTAGKTVPVSRTSIELSPDGKTLVKKFSVIASNKREAREFQRFGATVSYRRRGN